MHVPLHAVKEKREATDKRPADMEVVPAWAGFTLLPHHRQRLATSVKTVIRRPRMLLAGISQEP